MLDRLLRRVSVDELSSSGFGVAGLATLCPGVLMGHWSRYGSWKYISISPGGGVMGEVNGAVPSMNANLTRVEMSLPRWRHSNIRFRSPDDRGRQCNCCRFSLGHMQVFQIDLTCGCLIKFWICTGYSHSLTSKPSSKCLAMCSKNLSRVADESSAVSASKVRSLQVPNPQAKTTCAQRSVRAVLLGSAFILCDSLACVLYALSVEKVKWHPLVRQIHTTSAP